VEHTDVRVQESTGTTYKQFNLSVSETNLTCYLNAVTVIIVFSSTLNTKDYQGMTHISTTRAHNKTNHTNRINNRSVRHTISNLTCHVTAMDVIFVYSNSLKTKRISIDDTHLNKKNTH
jgi:multidrug efflux pump subunit AcrB